MSKDRQRENKEAAEDKAAEEKKASQSEEMESTQDQEASAVEADVDPVRVNGRKIGEKAGNLRQREKWFQQRRR